MNPLGQAAGLWMLVCLGALTVVTGLPVWALLVGVASAFAAGGLAGGVFDLAILTAMPARLVGLLEHDLLQALPLYVFVGVLLQRLPLADSLYAALSRLMGRLGAAPSLAALGVGALIAPMNGSVASSSALLSGLTARRLTHLAPARAVALGASAATIGVVVPPSLVLILLGDAMLRAHTEASNLPGFTGAGQRIVNTQDTFHAALLPALGVLIAWALVAWWQGRTADASADVAPAPAASRADLIRAGLTALAILALLGGVFTGKLLAVEAAATGGCLLALGAWISRALSSAQWRRVLADTLALTGALFALLMGATVFSLVMRLFGTDRLVADALLAPTVGPRAMALAVLVAVALCAWVLDAFEMIFVVVPIVAPPLIAMLGDAQQSAVLLLLVLQLGFLLPPMGYAVLIARNRARQAVSVGALLRALAPYLAAQMLMTALVFIWPAAVHGLDAQEASAPANKESTQDVEERMRQMGMPTPDNPDTPEFAPDDAGAAPASAAASTSTR